MKLKLLLLTFLIFIQFGFTQSVRITSIIEGPCGTTDQEQPRIIEVYVDGTIDVTNYHVQVYIEGLGWILPDRFAIGTVSNGFFYIVSDMTTFDSEFPGIPPTNKGTGSTPTFSNGARAIRIIDSGNGDQVLDIFGLEEDGVGENWEYTNTVVRRNSGTTATSTFNINDWTIQPIGSLNGLGLCNASTALINDVPLGVFLPTLSIENFNEGGFQLSPNPVSTSFNIDLGLSSNQETNIHLFNLLGQEVLYEKNYKNNNPIDISVLEKGFYIIHLNHNSKNYTTKLLKK